MAQAQQAVMQKYQQAMMQPNPQQAQLEIQQMAASLAKQEEAEVEKIIRNPSRIINIDIETDSTLRGDLTRDMEQFNQLITATGTFATAISGIGPILPMTVKPLFSVYASQVAKFRLGKMGEDALDELVEAAKQPPQNPDAKQGMSPEEMQAQEQQQQHEQTMAQQQAQDKAADRDVKVKLGEQKLQLGQQKMQQTQVETEAEMAADDNRTKNEALLAKLQATLGTALPSQQAPQPNGLVQ
jgi:hypothetical protein